MDELVLPLLPSKKRVKAASPCDQHHDRLEDDVLIGSLVCDTTGDSSSNQYTAAAGVCRGEQQQQQQEKQQLVLLNEEDNNQMEESRHRGGGGGGKKLAAVFLGGAAPPPAAGVLQLETTSNCCTTRSGKSRMSSPPPDDDEQQQQQPPEENIMDVSMKEEGQTEAKEEQEHNNKNKDSVDPLQQLTSYQQRKQDENKQQHKQLDLLLTEELNDDAFLETSTSSTPRSRNKKRKILAPPPRTEEEKDDRDDSKRFIDEEASERCSISSSVRRNKILAATNSIRVASPPPGIGRPSTSASTHKDHDSSTGDQEREDDHEQKSDTILKEDDEGDIITKNISLAQQKMMRFFFGAAADETTKNNGMSDQDDAMKERKVTTKDATNRRMYIRFPHKLMYTLECGDYSNILSWNFNGTSFKIEDRDLFEMKVLPEIFKDAKFSSFRRKLNRWYFKRHRSERVFTVSHPYFRRGNYSLCDLMVCGDSKQCDLQQPGSLESIPPSAVLGKQGAVYGQQETSRLVDHSVIDHVTQQAKCSILGQQYPKFYPQNNIVTTTAAPSSGFYPTTAMAPPRFDPVTSSTGLLLQHQGATSGHGISLVPNDYHGSVTMQPNMTQSSPWWLNDTPCCTTTNSSVNAFPSSYSSSVLFDNITAVGDSSLPGTSSRIPVSSGQSLDARHVGSVLPSESSFQVIYPGGSNQILSSSGYLPAAQTLLPPEYVVSNGIGASLLSTNRPLSNIDSNYFCTPPMNNNFDYNFGMNASFDNSLTRICTVAQISQPGTTEYNVGAGHDSHYLLPATNTQNTLRMPPFAMIALPQQQQPLNPRQRTPPGTRDNVKDSMAK